MKVEGTKVDAELRGREKNVRPTFFSGKKRQRASHGQYVW